ncbi:hypothetical protein ACFLVN_04035 [Chloroflexota bacterium]
MLYTRIDYHGSFSYLTMMNEKGEIIDQNGEEMEVAVDLCNVMGIPPLVTMIEKLQAIVDVMCNTSHLGESISDSFLRVGLELLEKKRVSPVIFVNDLIQPDVFMSLVHSLTGKMAIYTPESQLEREDQFTFHFDIVREINEQALNRGEFLCPLTVVWEKLSGQRKRRKLCLGTSTGPRRCCRCMAGLLVDEWLAHRVEDPSYDV